MIDDDNDDAHYVAESFYGKEILEMKFTK